MHLAIIDAETDPCETGFREILRDIEVELGGSPDQVALDAIAADTIAVQAVIEEKTLDTPYDLKWRMPFLKKRSIRDQRIAASLTTRTHQQVHVISEKNVRDFTL